LRQQYDDDETSLTTAERLEAHTADLHALDRRVTKLEERRASEIAQRDRDRAWAEQRFRRLDRRLAAIVVKLKAIWRKLGTRRRKS